MPDESQAASEGRPESEGPADERRADGAEASADAQPPVIPGETPADTQDAANVAEALLDEVHAAVSDANARASVGGQRPLPSGASPMGLPDFDSAQAKTPPAGLDLLADVSLNVKIELGRTRMLVEDVLKLSDGAVVELDKLAGDPVDIYVNERHVARGEVLVLNDNFCVRINEIVDPDERKAG